jgi:hypothetical protein
MPVIRFPANYPLPQSQAALLADPDALPGFNPTDDPGPGESVSAGDPTPIPPSPSTAGDAQDANTVALPPLNGNNGAGKKFKLPPGRTGAMPPPEAAPPPAAPGAVPPTPSPEAAAGAPTEPPTGAPPPDMAAGLEPAAGAPKTTAEKLAALQPPDRPNSNWAQRLGMAVLSLTKYAPLANQIIHPKWAEQQQGYLGQRQALEAQQQEEISQGQAEAGEAQKEAVAEWRHAQAEPHKGQQEIDPQYAQQNMPWLKPDANGQFWVDKAVANTLSKPDKAAALHVVPAGSSVVDENGKLLFSAPEKPEKPAGTFEKDFLPGWAQQHGKTIDQLQGTERQRALQDFNASQADKDPEMRAARLASMQTAEILKQMQLQQQPTPEQAAQVATDVIHHRLAPEQMSQMFGGFGPTGQAFKRMVYGEAKKIDPNFDFEQAAADYNFSKSPAFQNTVRMMDSALNSTDRLQQSANALANGKVRSINALVNAGRDQFNSVNLRKFQTDRTLVGDEVAKVLQGGGTGSGTSDAKLKQAQDIFRDSDDPAVIASAINEVKQIMGYRRQAVTRGTYMEGKTPPEAPAGSKDTSSGPITVAAPNGKTYHFKDQKSADTFKKNAGIQ